MKTLRVALGVWAAAALWLGSNAGVSMPEGLFVWVGAIVALIVLAIASAARRRLLLRDGAVVLLVWTLIVTGLAFRVRFTLSMPFLARYVRETRASHQKPRILGLFRVTETEVVGDTVRLITTACDFADHCGVAFRQRGQPPVTYQDRYEHLVGGWWRWDRGW